MNTLRLNHQNSMHMHVKSFTKFYERKKTGHCQCLNEKSNLNTCIHLVTNVYKYSNLRHLGKIIRLAFLAFPRSYASVIPNLDESLRKEVILTSSW